eukprot:12509988-Alexandrium_andersonii.AAC.1
MTGLCVLRLAVRQRLTAFLSARWQPGQLPTSTRQRNGFALPKGSGGRRWGSRTGPAPPEAPR